MMSAAQITVGVRTSAADTLPPAAAFIRCDTAEALSIKPHQVIESDLWWKAVEEGRRRNLAERFD